LFGPGSVPEVKPVNQTYSFNHVVPNGFNFHTQGSHPSKPDKAQPTNPATFERENTRLFLAGPDRGALIPSASVTSAAAAGNVVVAEKRLAEPAFAPTDKSVLKLMERAKERAASEAVEARVEVKAEVGLVTKEDVKDGTVDIPVKEDVDAKTQEVVEDKGKGKDLAAEDEHNGSGDEEEGSVSGSTIGGDSQAQEEKNSEGGIGDLVVYERTSAAVTEEVEEV